MKAGTAWLLGRPAAPADRTRFGLVAGTTAVAGGLLLAGSRIARLGVDSDRARTWTAGGGWAFADGGGDGGLAPYVSQAGLRPGVVLGAVLLAVPVLALAVQALRLGSVARERRLAGLRLAGATPSDVRRVAAWEAGAAAALGGLLAGPAYLVLWLLLGVLPSAGQRLLPDPGWLDVPFWILGVVVAAVAGAVSGALVQGQVLLDPLGVRTRTATHRPGRRGALVALAGTMLVAVGVVGMHQDATTHWTVVLGAAVLGLLVAAFAATPRLVARRGGRLARGRGVANLLAGRRLAADPRTTGRVCAVLALCGVALGVEAVMVWDLVIARAGENFGDDLSFYLTGYAFATGGVLVATVVAAATLVVGVADQLTDARRPLAALRALGADEHVLQTALRRQQTAAAGPSAALGVVAGGLGVSWFLGDTAAAVPPTVLAVAVVWLAVSGTTRLAVRLLRTRLRAATDPENLRVA